METNQEEYLTIWDNTVNFRQLLLGLVGGALMGYFSFIGGAAYLKANHPGAPSGLMQGYALLFGVAGSVLSGIIAGIIFKPKRIFHEEGFQLDKQTVLKELNVDLHKESEYLKTVPPEVIAEMKKLQLYDLFTEDREEAKVVGIAE